MQGTATTLGEECFLLNEKKNQNRYELRNRTDFTVGTFNSP